MAERTSKLVDFHCHLDLYPEFEKLFGQCDELGIYTLAVTTTPRAWKRNHELASRTKHVRAALGIHPQIIAKHGADIALFEELLPRTRYVGEVGLDASRTHYGSFEKQQAVFERVLKACASSDGKIISVHSVRSAKVVLDMIEKYLPEGVSSVVMHWFSGSAAEARRAVDLGCWFSVNSQMLENSRSAEIVAAIVPKDRILTETDGPFTKAGSKPARPSDVSLSVASLGKCLGMGTDEVRLIVHENLRRLLADVPAPVSKRL